MRPIDYLTRVKANNGDLNAFLDMTGETNGTFSWAVKSNIAVQGLPLTAGIEAYRNHLAVEDASIVKRIRASGGVVLGTVNMHEGALGATTDNQAYGRTCNPWCTDLTPGGSSGGSGVAVAARFCDVALGSDTMGSVRIPAAYCGVCGHKPTTGLLSNDGVLALSPTLDHVGPLARNVQTLWKAMGVLAEWADGALLPVSLSGLRIGVWLPEKAEAMEADLRASMANTMDILQAAGANLLPFAPPLYEENTSRRAGLLVSEVEGHAIHKDMLEENPDGFSDNFRGMLEWGARQSPAKVQAAFAHIAEVRDAAKTVWNAVDVVIAPTAPQAAFAFDAPVPANQANFTAWANFAGLPATAIFSGFNDGGLPLSLQIIGAPHQDKVTLQVGAAIEALLGAAPAPPGYE